VIFLNTYLVTNEPGSCRARHREFDRREKGASDAARESALRFPGSFE
jgi:hypothetical protein